LKGRSGTQFPKKRKIIRTKSGWGIDGARKGQKKAKGTNLNTKRGGYEKELGEKAQADLRCEKKEKKPGGGDQGLTLEG